MHREILNIRQTELLPLVAQFRREYYLVGGTAIALYLGHRRSIDFDLFKFSAINHKRNLEKISKTPFRHLVTRRVSEQMNLIVNDVKITFFQYPFPIEPTVKFEGYFRLPSLIQLAAMKAYALGRRSKWKDYVDLYFLLRDHFTIADISDEAARLYGELYSEKMFRSQLCYFEDIDYSEAVDFLVPNPPTDKEIKQTLTEMATKGVEG
ncbi:MAG: nucleotidyl transferase AbiEii/AbiGii toxin family protein [Prevotella sp.]|nr:nucleotidyl transferase AbiEii/AbiGii toxin family protein [Prevotella sp.]